VCIVRRVEMQKTPAAMEKALYGRRISGLTDRHGFDLETWPKPEVGGLSTKDLAIYKKRETGVKLAASGASDRHIKRTCDVGLRQILRLIAERCLRPHPDGRIYGYRGLLYRLRINPTVRKRPVRLDPGGRGGVGAMENLLALAPEFKNKLDRTILRTYPSDELAEVKRPRSSLYQWFLKELRALGYENRKEWPFDRQDTVSGYGALCRYVDKTLKGNPRVAARAAGGEKLVRKLRAGDGVDRPVYRPYQRVEMDAHKLDGRFCVLIPQATGGWSPKIIHRLWVIVLIEIVTRAVLGFYLSMRREVNKEDVLRAIKVALSPWAPRPVTFREEALADGAGLPASLGPNFIGICWEETSVDGALAETCRTVAESLATVVGSRLLEPENSFSARRSLDDRPFIETFFRTLASRGLQRLSNSTGPNPQKKLVNNPDDVAVASNFQYDWMIELLQRLICEYNATPHSSLGHRSPLEMLRYLESSGALPKRLADPDLVQGLLSYRKLCTVRGGASEGRAPYVNFAGARYGGPHLGGRDDLVGQKVWMINYLEDDARVGRCVTTSGILVGVLRAAPPWHKLPHSLAIRSAIISLGSKRRLGLGNDAISSFIEFVESQPGKRLPVHPAYLDIRRILAEQAVTHEGDRAAARALNALATQATADEPVDAIKPMRIGGEADKTRKTNLHPADQQKSSRPLPPKRLAAN